LPPPVGTVNRKKPGSDPAAQASLESSGALFTNIGYPDSEAHELPTPSLVFSARALTARGRRRVVLFYQPTAAAGTWANVAATTRELVV
jgi:hypothetical protein